MLSEVNINLIVILYKTTKINQEAKLWTNVHIKISTKNSSFQTKTPAEKLQNSSFDMTVLLQVWMRQEVYRKTCSLTWDTCWLIDWLSSSRIWFHLYGDVTIAGNPAGTRRLLDVVKWLIFSHDVGNVVWTFCWRQRDSLSVSIISWLKKDVLRTS
jgi:hypothetical protein